MYKTIDSLLIDAAVSGLMIVPPTWLGNDITREIESEKVTIVKPKVQDNE